MSARSDPSPPRPHVVVLGGGFAGLTAARRLKGAPVRITVVDRRNHHLFQPLLYQVATAALAPGDIAHPIREVFRKQPNVEQILLDEARGIDLARRRVLLDEGHLDYDTLIIATGSTHSYFGNDQWEKHAPGLKTVEDALEIRRRVLLAFERAERHPEDQERHLTFVVVGGGPTGVELAGALREIAVDTLAEDFDHIDPRRARVVLAEGSDRVLPPFVEELSRSARKQLESLGVEVMTGAMATEIDEHGVRFADGRSITSSTVLWAAGVQASPLAKSLGVELDKAGRVPVAEDLSVPGHPEVFVLGDLAAATCDGAPVPGLAPAAIQGGQHAARCVRADLAGKPRPKFRYRDKGTLATIGRARAVADLGKLKFGGWPAWLAWMLIHVFFLIGFRNRVFVMLSWAWNYLTFRRGARLITGGMNGRAATGPDPPHDAPDPDASVQAEETEEAYSSSGAKST